MGLFDFGDNPAVGFSPNTSERAQRYSLEEALYLGGAGRVGQRDLYNLLLTGQWDPLSLRVDGGVDVTSGFGGPPQGPAWQILQQSLGNEINLSDLRQSMASGIMQNYGQSAPGSNAFNRSAVGFGTRAMPSQEQMFRDLFNTQQSNLGLQNQLMGEVGNYIASGGEGSPQQRQLIEQIYGQQRLNAMSDLNKQYSDRLLDLGEFSVTRGLNPTDTPIQDRGGQLTQEYLRNVQSVIASLAGQEANALLNTPFQQNQVNLGALFNTQGTNLNALNAFSLPIANAFNAGNAINAQGQFGMQYSPAAYAAAPVQNFQALLGSQAGFSPINPIGSFQPQMETPSFGQQLGGAVAGALGGGLGQGAAAGVGYAVGGPLGALSTQNRLPQQQQYGWA